MTEASHPPIPVKNAYRMTSPPADPAEPPAAEPIPFTTLHLRPLWRIAPPEIGRAHV